MRRHGLQARAHSTGDTRFGDVLVEICLGMAAMAQGRVEEAGRAYHRARQGARKRLSADPWLAASTGVLALELDLERNREKEMTRRAIENMAAPGGIWVDVRSTAIGVSAELMLARDGSEAAVELLSKSLRNARATGIASLSNHVAALLTGCLAEAGHPDEAAQVWLEQGLPCAAAELLDVERRSWRTMEALCCGRIRLLAAQGESGAADELATRLCALASEHRLTRTLLRGLALSMVVAQRAGQPERAVARIAEFLRAAHSVDYVRPLVRHRDVSRTVLRLLLTTNPDDDLRAAAESMQETLGAPPVTGPAAFFSTRELEVLEAAARGLRNKEMAARLGISTPGVRYHLRNIRRREAGGRGRARAVVGGAAVTAGRCSSTICAVRRFQPRGSTGIVSSGRKQMRIELTWWRRTMWALVGLLAFGLGMAASVASAAGRVALVVGNGAYAAIGALPNPGNDASDVAAALGRLGFDVTTVRDADLPDMNEALRLFARESAGADVAVVFYAGHGLEVDGVNYLVPVDAQLERDTDVEYEALPLDRVLRATAGASLRVVILDACRNNPLARSMQRTGATRSVSRGSFGDLDENLLGDETLVAYAAAAGTVAADGTGRNSPYTSALLTHLEEPLELSALFRRVRSRVLAATRGEQRPHEYGSLLSEHYLGGAPGPATATVTAADGASATSLAQQETVFWESIRESSDPAMFEAYLRQYPAGAFRVLATTRLAGLRPVAGDPPSRERRAPGTVFRDCADCPELVVIPAGRFRMGCVSGRDCEDDERPVHDVELRSFALGKYEVTFEEYERFSRATGRDRPNDAGWGRGGRPVINVSWEDAEAYVAWLSRETGEAYRLPSESEWEYAARARTTTRYTWGQDIGRNRANCRDCGSRWDGDRTAPAGSFASNGWGVHDMHGNVWEWVADCWHENYARAPRDGLAWTRGGNCGRRVLRGGSWSFNPVYLRSADRGNLVAGARGASGGFRVSRTLD